MWAKSGPKHMALRGLTHAFIKTPVVELILEHCGQCGEERLVGTGRNVLAPRRRLVRGRQLAVKMARLVIKATQPDDAIRGRMRDVHANDAGMLLQVGQVVATEFATIATANNHWRAWTRCRSRRRRKFRRAKRPVRRSGAAGRWTPIRTGTGEWIAGRRDGYRLH